MFLLFGGIAFIFFILALYFSFPNGVFYPAPLFYFTLVLILLILYLYSTFRFHFRDRGLSVRSRPVSRPNRPPAQPIKDQQRQFYTVFDVNTTCKIFQPGMRHTDWKSCKLNVYPAYVALYIGSRWRKNTLTFNTQNMMWFGHIQHIDETISEICLDLDVDDVWYTVWVRMLRPDMKDFVAELEHVSPEMLLFNRNRYHPHIRHNPIKAHWIDVENSNRWKINSVSELYLTPLYLVALIHTFVSQVIPIDSIQSFKVEAIAESSNDYRILRLMTDIGLADFVIQNDPDFEALLAQLVR